MPTLNIPAQTVQPGVSTGAWHNIPNGVTSLVATVDLTAFTDLATVFGMRTQIGPTPGQWGLSYVRGKPTQVSVQARYIAAVGSLDADGNPQLSGGNPVAIGASSVVVS